jgi:hypothetical protein
MHAWHDHTGASPSLRADAVTPNGEVAIKADRHAPGSCDLRGLSQLLVSNPLHPGEKIDPAPMVLREAGDIARKSSSVPSSGFSALWSTMS